MKDVFDARQVHALLASEELDHPNSSDIVFRIPPPVGGRPLRLDQVLALVNHQGAGVEVEDLAGDAGREYRPPWGDCRRALSLSHITPTRGAFPSPRIGITLYPRYHLLPRRASLPFPNRALPGMPRRVRRSDAGDRAVHPAPPQGLPSDRGGQSS